MYQKITMVCEHDLKEENASGWGIFKESLFYTPQK